MRTDVALRESLIIDKKISRQHCIIDVIEPGVTLFLISHFNRTKI